MFDVKSKDIIEIVLKKLGLFYKINKTQIPNLCKLSLIANSTNDVIGYSLFQTNPSDQKVTIHTVIIKKLLREFSEKARYSSDGMNRAYNLKYCV